MNRIALIRADHGGVQGQPVLAIVRLDDGGMFAALVPQQSEKRRLSFTGAVVKVAAAKAGASSTHSKRFATKKVRGRGLLGRKAPAWVWMALWLAGVGCEGTR